MNIQLHIIIFACIANFLLIFVQPHNQIVYQAVRNKVINKRENPENYQHLFNSGVEEDTRKNGIYYKFLMNKVGREQQDFDKMKEELWNTQIRNTFKKSNSHRRISDSKNIVAVKREVAETGANEVTTKIADETTQRIVPPKPEKIDEFYDYQEPIDEFNHYKPSIIYDWKRVIEAYDVKDIKFLRYLCTKVHELAQWGPVKVINNFIMDKAVIVYKNPMYFPTDMKFLQYVIDSPQTFENNETMDHFYITEGLKEDCIFYLIPTDPIKLNAFNLGHHVCGVHRALRGTNATTEVPVAPLP